MRNRTARTPVQTELIVAIGMVWGYLKVSQFERAYQLARGCLRIWPDDMRLLLMTAFAAVELLEPLDEKMQAALAKADCREWADVVLRRSQTQTATA